MGIMRAKFINEFERGINPKAALGLGRVGKIQKLFAELYIDESEYYFEKDTNRVVVTRKIFDISNLSFYEGEIILPDFLTIIGRLDLRGARNISKLPMGLRVIGGDCITMSGESNITELPPDLYVDGDLHINGTLITDIPETVHIGGQISVDDGGNQLELKRNLQNSKFAGQIYLYKRN